jgi:hypothetical protein
MGFEIRGSPESVICDDEGITTLRGEFRCSTLTVDQEGEVAIHSIE